MSHNIVGSEASTAKRLVAFSHAHGSIRMIGRPARLPLTLLAFAAGAALAAGVVACLIARPWSLH